MEVLWTFRVTNPDKLRAPVFAFFTVGDPVKTSPEDEEGLWEEVREACLSSVAADGNALECRGELFPAKCSNPEQSKNVHQIILRKHNLRSVQPEIWG